MSELIATPAASAAGPGTAMIGGDGASVAEMAKLSGNPVEFFKTMGKSIAQSGMLGVKTEAQGMTLLMACACEKKTPFELHREYHIMEDGKLTMRADAMLAKFRGIGGDYRIVQRDADGAVIEMTYRGQVANFSLSWAEAQQEPFVYAKNKELKTNYATPRARTQMMWARVVSDGVRAMAPEVVAGVYTPEEMDDAAGENRAASAPRETRRAAAAIAVSTSSSPTNPATPATPATPTPTAAPAIAPSVPASGEVIDADFTVTDDKPPFAESNGQAGSATSTAATAATSTGEPNGFTETTTLMEIELTLSELGLAKSDLESKLAAKYDGVRTLDDLSAERATAVLTNLRGLLAKKRESAVQAA